MGQYHMVFDLDKREYIHPHKFNDGLKLLEWGCSAKGTSTALAILLAESNGRGGGDLRFDSKLGMTEGVFNSIVGRWAGDRIVVSGDYADDGRWGLNGKLWDYLEDEDAVSGEEQFKDISHMVLAVMLHDPYLRKEILGAKYWPDGRKQVPVNQETIDKALALLPGIDFEAMQNTWTQEHVSSITYMVDCLRTHLQALPRDVCIEQMKKLRPMGIDVGFLLQSSK